MRNKEIYYNEDIIIVLTRQYLDLVGLNRYNTSDGAVEAVLTLYMIRKLKELNMGAVPENELPTQQEICEGIKWSEHEALLNFINKAAEQFDKEVYIPYTIEVLNELTEDDLEPILPTATHPTNLEYMKNTVEHWYDNHDPYSKPFCAWFPTITELTRKLGRPLRQETINRYKENGKETLL